MNRVSLVSQLCFSFAILVLCYSSANAKTSWSMAAQGCAVDPATKSLAINSGDGGVHFATGSTGTFYLICPIVLRPDIAPPTSCSGNHLVLSFTSSITDGA